MRVKWLAAAAAVLFAGNAYAAEVSPAVIYDIGGKHDKSFNESAFAGEEQFKKDTGIGYHEFEIQNPSQYDQALRNFARRGYQPIIAIGFSQAQALEKVSKEFPKIQFGIVDATVDAPNVRSLVFREEEGSYLVGMLAALKSETGKIGFVGGMDIPLIRKFACGYVQGAKAVNPKIEIFQNMVGTTGDAWNDPVKGGELAKSQLSRGADVIYTAAGASGLGAMQAAADAKKYSIGVDSNQDDLHPGSVLTSMVKHVDTAIYSANMDMKDGKWTGGAKVLGLKENGVGYTSDQYNKDVLTADMKSKADEAKAKIISGEIKVHDYTADNSCPM
ncbi:nucleoside-binding protein [Faunimonas pinastri]|uniref:Nucleoside-binding protein n=1 Tax=Faunimonas pinastri TaxID=1855383 RepID=A0A1H9HJZ8_9HYPH|nr:BMP family ABC transporter substrate-binding protein [Faunimonas pinastri]SEQ62670.1 nucleoside-binding protein [Faunimonas pinastri]